MAVSPSPQNIDYGIDFFRKDTTPLHTLGLTVLASNGNTYKYGRASATITALSFLHTIYATSIHNVDHPAAVGLPLAGCAHIGAAINEYFWYVISGVLALTNVTTASVAGDVLGSTASAGRLGSLAVTTPTAAETVAIRAAAGGVGVIAVTAGSANTATVRLH